MASKWRFLSTLLSIHNLRMRHLDLVLLLLCCPSRQFFTLRTCVPHDQTARVVASGKDVPTGPKGCRPQMYFGMSLLGQLSSSRIFYVTYQLTPMAQMFDCTLP